MAAVMRLLVRCMKFKDASCYVRGELLRKASGRYRHDRMMGTGLRALFGNWISFGHESFTEAQKVGGPSYEVCAVP